MPSINTESARQQRGLEENLNPRQDPLAMRLESKIKQDILQHDD